MTKEELLNIAEEAMQNAYAPYSHFKVGAALEAKSGKIYTGCNIENISFGASNCAERTALFTAVAAGEREFNRIAIVGGKDGIIKAFCYPCGICRQAFAEFTDIRFEVILKDGDENIITTNMDDLLPDSFQI